MGNTEVSRSKTLAHARKARFVFNCYMHWAQLLLRETGDPLVTILSQEGVNQGYPLSMVLYRITPVPLDEELRALGLGMLSPFY